MNDAFFSHSFVFRTYEFEKFKFTDNRAGAPSHYFAYMLSGSCRIVTENMTVKIKEGDIFYIPDKCSYKSYWYGTPEIKFISLGFMFMLNFDNLYYPVQIIPKCSGAAELFCRLKNKSRPSAEDIGVFYTLSGLLIPLMKCRNMCRSKEIVERAKEYLTNNPYAPPREIAKSCAISESALYDAFKKSSDVSLNRLKNNMRLEMSRELLITTDKPIEYISDFLKFSSPSYFRKNFRKYFNMTPTQMRKSRRI